MFPLLQAVAVRFPLKNEKTREGKQKRRRRKHAPINSLFHRSMFLTFLCSFSLFKKDQNKKLLSSGGQTSPSIRGTGERIGTVDEAR